MSKSLILEEAEIPENKSKHYFRWHAEEKALWVHFGIDPEFNWAEAGDYYNSAVITAFLRNETTSPQAAALRRAVAAMQDGMDRKSEKFRKLLIP